VGDPQIDVAKRSNRLDAYVRAVAFLGRHLA